MDSSGFGLAILSLAAFVGNLAAQCNLLPVAVEDQGNFFGQTISVEPMLNDSGPDGEALLLSVVAHNCDSPSSGFPISVATHNGTLRLTPTQPGYPTTCTVAYRIEDENGFTDDAVVQIGEVALFLHGFETGSTAGWSDTITSGASPEP